MNDLPGGLVALAGVSESEASAEGALITQGLADRGEPCGSRGRGVVPAGDGERGGDAQVGVAGGLKGPEGELVAHRGDGVRWVLGGQEGDGVGCTKADVVPGADRDPHVGPWSAEVGTGVAQTLQAVPGDREGRVLWVRSKAGPETISGQARPTQAVGNVPSRSSRVVIAPW